MSYFFSYRLNNNPADAHKIHAFTFLYDILKRVELRKTPKSDSAHPTGFHTCILDINILSKIKTINPARIKGLQNHVWLKTVYIPLYIQKEATLHSLFISGICSTCFGCYFHPSSGVHTTVSTAPGICHTVTAICRYRGRAPLFHDSGR
jgi:hypothetical protein